VRSLVLFIQLIIHLNLQPKMDAKTFVYKTQELVPNEENMRIVGTMEVLIKESLTNFLTLKDMIIDESNPIIWIIKNCVINKFSTGHIYFIETFIVEGFQIVAQAEADYIGINLLSNKIYLIGYEQIDEFLYGDGDIPDFENIYLIAEDSYKFLDALVERLKFNKLLAETPRKSFEEMLIIEEPFKIEAVRLAGGNEYQFWRVF
ncbi:hypothetical protein, partial [Emticicia fontis]